jgi:predicted nucleotidyltransferase
MDWETAANRIRMERHAEAKCAPSAEARLRLAGEAGRFLRERGAKRVWLFGSLARGQRQDWRSDLDLATEGLPPERYLECLGELLMRLPVSIDLVEIERAPAAIRDTILQQGIELGNED